MAANKLVGKAREYLSQAYSPVANKVEEGFSRLPNGVRENLVRYGPSQAVATVASWVAAKTTYGLTNNSLSAGAAATWASNIAYLGTSVARDVYRANKEAKMAGRNITASDITNIIKQQGAEIGLPQVVDNFVSGPLLVSEGIKAFGPNIGQPIGGAVATGVFYALTIGGCELRKRFGNKMEGSLARV